MAKNLDDILEPGWRVKLKYRETGRGLLSSVGPDPDPEPPLTDICVDERLAEALNGDAAATSITEKRNADE